MTKATRNRIQMVFTVLVLATAMIVAVANPKARNIVAGRLVCDLPQGVELKAVNANLLWNYKETMAVRRNGIIATPDFEIEYSPRFTEATVAEIEEILMIWHGKAVSSRFLSIIQLATAWVRK